ncbi:barstar family protein [Alkalibacter mobilis]|uniref:barstar family protein n=1 Tax=Alkalibacter mobilis TaxID=2787712 RepID=UPI00189D2B1E|nr:barstar family protein [Alkalibacter mobilis]MBF7097488.1 barstar family protein [Alkalibacter mobilis]
MRRIRLNGNKMTEKEMAHKYLRKKLNLPDHYGDNLDALWDCLVTDYTPQKIVLENTEKIVNGMGSYGEALIMLLKEVAEENGFLELEIENEENLDI